MQFQAPFVVFKLQQWHWTSAIKQQIKAGVPEADLVQLKIAKSWEQGDNDRFERKHSREFKFDGEWYDVVKSEDLGDSTLYYCIHDIKEGQLFAQLEEITQSVMDSDSVSEKRAQIISWLSLEYDHVYSSHNWPHLTKELVFKRPSTSPIFRGTIPSTPPPNSIG